MLIRRERDQPIARGARSEHEQCHAEERHKEAETFLCVSWRTIR